MAERTRGHTRKRDDAPEEKSARRREEENHGQKRIRDDADPRDEAHGSKKLMINNVYPTPHEEFDEDAEIECKTDEEWSVWAAATGQELEKEHVLKAREEEMDFMKKILIAHRLTNRNVGKRLVRHQYRPSGLILGKGMRFAVDGWQGILRRRVKRIARICSQRCRRWSRSA